MPRHHTTEIVFAGTLVVLVVVFGAAYRNFFVPKEAAATPPAPIVFTPNVPTILSDDPAKGPADAKFTIVEFGDFTCTSCKEAATSMHALLDKRNDVRFIWKDAPSKLHFLATPAAVAARCAHIQGKFWEYYNLLFGTPLGEEAQLAEYAAALELNRTQFAACQKSDASAKRISASWSQAMSLGVDGTPTFYINGKPFGTLLTVAEFEAALAEAAQVNK